MKIMSCGFSRPVPGGKVLHGGILHRMVQLISGPVFESLLPHHSNSPVICKIYGFSSTNFSAKTFLIYVVAILTFIAQEKVELREVCRLPKML